MRRNYSTCLASVSSVTRPVPHFEALPVRKPTEMQRKKFPSYYHPTDEYLLSLQDGPEFVNQSELNDRSKEEK